MNPSFYSAISLSEFLYLTVMNLRQHLCRSTPGGGPVQRVLGEEHRGARRPDQDQRRRRRQARAGAAAGAEQQGGRAGAPSAG